MITINKASCLDAPIKVDALNGVAFTKEQGAHKFIVSCNQNGEKLNLTGTITGKFTCNGRTIEIALDYAGIDTDGNAWVILPQHCYDYAGRFQLAIFNTVGDTTFCVYACVGNVQISQIGDPVDGGEIIDSVETLIQNIEDAVDSIPPTYTELVSRVDNLESARNGFNGTLLYQLGTVKTDYISVPKGTTRKQLIQFDLKANEEITIKTTLSSALDKSTYLYLYDESGNNIYTSASIGIPANTTEREFTYTPQQDYHDAQLLYTVTGSASTNASISIEITASGAVYETIQGVRDDLDDLDDEVTEFKNDTLGVSYNVWSADPTYTFTRYTTIPINIPAGNYTISAEVTTNNPNATGARILFRNQTLDYSTYVLLSLNDRSYKIVTLTQDCTEVLIYAADTANAASGYVATWTNIMLMSGFGQRAYITHMSAADKSLRQQLSVPELIDISGKSLVDVNLWEIGSISYGFNVNNNSGQVSIRTKNHIKVDPTKKLYFQAYYTLPDSTENYVPGNNDYLVYVYIAQYDKELNYISTIRMANPSSASTQLYEKEILCGKENELDPLCAYVRIQIYTVGLSGNTVSDIMPGTIYIDQVTDNLWLPPYYDGYLENKAELIEHYMRGEELANGVWKKVYQQSDMIPFVFITDEHAPQQNQMRSPALIRRLADMVHIPAVFSGGDIDHWGELTYVFPDALRKCFDGKIYHAVGNHDFLHGNTGSSLYYDLDVYNTDQVGSQDHHYYYVDNPEQKVRYIVLAAFMESETTRGTGEAEESSGGYTQEQKLWLDKALSTDYEHGGTLPTGWDVIAITHYFYMVRLQQNQYGVLVNMADGYRFAQALSDNPSTIAIFQGHTHLDRIINNSFGIPEVTPPLNIRNDLPFIVTSCDKNIPNSAYTVVNRATGTIYEQLFDVVIINRATKKIHLVRIGGKAQNGVNDSVGSEVEERLVSYGSQTEEI